MKSYALALVVVLGSVVCPPLAIAADSIEVRERRALAACDSNRIQDGIDILAGLWAETLDPAYIYNQGRCYQKNDRPKEALGRFREFLLKAEDRTSPLAIKADSFVKELEAELAMSNRPVRPGPQGTTEVAARPPSTPAPTGSTSEAALMNSPAPTPDGKPPVYKRPWVWAVGGALVALALTGLLLSQGGSSSPLCPPSDCALPTMSVANR